MGHIFISYSHKDKDYVHKLQETLQDEGFEVWIDDRIDYGEEWPAEIELRLDQCDAFIVVISDNAKKSKWVKNEVRRAERTNKQFFPLLLQGEPWLTIETIQWFDVKNRSMPDEKFFRRLANFTPRSKTYVPPLPLGEGRGEGEPAPKPNVVSNRTDAQRINGGDRRAATSYPKGSPTYMIIGGVAILVLLCLGFGVKYLLPASAAPTETLPAPDMAVTSQATAVLPAPTETQIPLTYTLEPPTFTPTPSTLISDKDGMTLLYVPAGEFTMGSDTSSDEQPIHKVYLDDFWIDETEVTNAMYAKCVGAGACKQPSSKNSAIHSSYYGDSEFDNYPVIYVDWNMAKTYCEWAGRELPTEAQWEKAARGTNGNIYPWGNEFDGMKVNFCNTNNCSNSWANKSFNDGYADVSPVGNYPSGQSVYGALDMAGNVWEWVSDWYNETYYQSSPLSNPLGPDSGTYRALRGGSWNNNDNNARSANRSRNVPSNAYNIFGFRCSRSHP